MNALTVTADIVKYLRAYGLTGHMVHPVMAPRRTDGVVVVRRTGTEPPDYKQGILTASALVEIEVYTATFSGYDIHSNVIEELCAAMNALPDCEATLLNTYEDWLPGANNANNMFFTKLEYKITEQ